MANPNHHICIHGHFYQPPRENPWLGVIEKQHSAAPFHDWNERITQECYARLARSPLYDGEGKIDDLYNCYAQLSFNLGPTLVNWLRQENAGLIDQIAKGERLGAASRGGYGHALAQAYSHPIMPLLNQRDMYTQIHWGLEHFRKNLGRSAKGMWLPECAIDMNTIRALIDHKVEFVILSPYQASKIRPFGEEHWKDVSDGSVDPRHPYRVFEVDGAGNTHFDRWINVIFYDPILSTRISFEHLLRDPEKLKHQVLDRFDENASLPQLVTIATDGEIYGHHEHRGDEALAHFLAKTAADCKLYVSNAEQYLAENPPSWEAKLWMGEDGKGSSWSCSHGVGRWYRDCGCQTGGPGEWNQKWRTGLRDAFDGLAWRVSQAFEKAGRKLFVDVWDARNDYISVLLDDSDDTREKFLYRHALKKLNDEEKIRCWRLLEASANAMYMYTSCGWFFNELSGIEPVQNMRYALRAAELAQPFSETDLETELVTALERAESNIDGQNGADIFRKLVTPTRYSPRVIAAAAMLSEMFRLPMPHTVHAKEVKIKGSKDFKNGRKFYGSVSLSDPRTMEYMEFKVFCIYLASGRIGAIVAPTGESPFFKRLLAIPDSELPKLLDEDEAIILRDLPERERELLLQCMLREHIAESEQRVKSVYSHSMPLLKAFTANNLPIPEILRKNAEHVIKERFLRLTMKVCKSGECSDESIAQSKAMADEAAGFNVGVDRSEATKVLDSEISAYILQVIETGDLNRLKIAVELTRFAQNSWISPDNFVEAREHAWTVIRETAPTVIANIPEPDREPVKTIIRELASALGFAPEVSSNI